MAADTKKLRWGIIGTGFIADTFASGVERSRTGQLVAVASRSLDSAEAFSAAHGGALQAFGSYDEILADQNVDAVYVATPHPFHREWTVRAAQARKHVLCEKPIGMHHAEAEEMIAAAADAGVFLMEAYMYRLAPQTARVVEIIRSGTLGEIGAIDAVFSFAAPYDPEARLFSAKLGGGGILDVGGYPASMAQLVAGAAAGEPFLEAKDFKALGEIGATGVDYHSTAVASFAGGIVARLTCGVALEQGMRAAIFGSEGRLEIPEPWLPAKFGGASELKIFRGSARDPEIITVDSPTPLYALEADAVGDAIAAGQTEATPPAVGRKESRALMRTLERWRAEVGINPTP